jgi:hypothetical protein
LTASTHAGFNVKVKFNGTVKSPEFAFPVIPAEAGIQYFQQVLDAGVRRHDASATFYGFFKLKIKEWPPVESLGPYRNP